MAPVIGRRGVAALYKRSLHLASLAHPGLSNPDNIEEMDLPALKSALTQLGSEQAASAGAALLLAFHELVNSLIGAALSQRLLGVVWHPFFCSPQDPPS